MSREYQCPFDRISLSWRTIRHGIVTVEIEPGEYDVWLSQPISMLKVIYRNRSFLFDRTALNELGPVHIHTVRVTEPMHGNKGDHIWLELERPLKTGADDDSWKRNHVAYQIGEHSVVCSFNDFDSSDPHY